MSCTMAEEDKVSAVEWKEKYMALEALLLKFRGQMSVIRELTTEKMQQLEKQVLEAEQRALKANQQVQWMEEHLKAVDVKPPDSELKLFESCQDLQVTLQDKDELIALLEQQLEEQKYSRIQDSKAVEEKAAKIKEWVMKKLKEFETENASLKETNQQQESQILELRNQIQGLEQALGHGETGQTKPGQAQRLSSLTFGCFQIRGKSPQVRTGPMSAQSTTNSVCTPFTQTDDRRPSTDGGTKHNPEFEAVSLRLKSKEEQEGEIAGDILSSSISSVLSSAEGEAELIEVSLTTSEFTETLGSDAAKEEEGFKCKVDVEDVSSDELNKSFCSKRLNFPSSSSDANMTSSILNPKRHIPSQDTNDTPASPKQPRLRTPDPFNDSVAVAKKHLSQPPAVSDAVHNRARNAISVLHALESQDTDLKQEMETMEDMMPSKGIPETPAEEPKNPDSFALMSGNKPPTPPLHRCPSWIGCSKVSQYNTLQQTVVLSRIQCITKESRIYAVAKSGIQLSETTCLDVANKDSSHPSSNPAFMLYTSLIYRNMTIPVYTTSKGRVTLLSSTQYSEESSSSEEEDGLEEFDLTSGEEESILCTNSSNSAKGKESPPSLFRAVSLSSMASESDYAIPPDAYSTDNECSEPENKLPKTCCSSSDSGKNEPMEKSGYLLKMVKTWKKTWKRHWFVLKDGELMYYKSPSDVIHKPQGQIELNASSTIARGDGKQTLQVVTRKHMYNLKADSPNLLEEWLSVLQCVLKIKAASPLFTQPDVQPVMSGYMTKVNHDYSKHVWCVLIWKTLYIFKCQEDKFPLGQIRLKGAQVEEQTSINMDIKSEQSADTIIIQALNQSSTHLQVDSQHKKAAWIYHLSVASGSNMGKVGTEFEKLVGNLKRVDGDPGSQLWRHSMLCFSKEALTTSLTTLPSQALQTEAIKLFKMCQLFINAAIDIPAIDYHVTLAQCALQVCLTHSELQSEIYCQLIKQTCKRQPYGQLGPIQCWQLLALCLGLFLPQPPILWLLQVHLKKHADARTEVGKYAIYCQRCVERTQQKGERQARPSRMEILSILLRNPYHHSLPFSVPVHFLNNTYQVVGFDASTTVEEFQNRLNLDTGIRKTGQSGFSLYSDDPTGQDLEHFLEGSLKICDIISKWEQAFKELHKGKSENTRTVKLTHKNRFYFTQQLRGETERERLLFAYQINEEIAAGHFPVNKELALEMSALLAQVEFGDVSNSAGLVSGQAKSMQIVKQVLERFYPKHYRRACSEKQLRQLSEKLLTRWASLKRRSVSECVRIYLTVARKWPFFGAKLFEAEPRSPSTMQRTRVWIAVHEDGLTVLEFTSIKLLVSFSYKNIVTFGGCHQDFMLVVSQSSGGNTERKKPTEKHVFAMNPFKSRELTHLMANYISNSHQQKSAVHHLSAPALLLPQSQCEEQRSKSPSSPGGRSGKALMPL